MEDAPPSPAPPPGEPTGAPAPTTDWAALMERDASGAPTYVPKAATSAPYASQAYWDWRFAQEPSHEWLGGYGAIAAHVRAAAGGGADRSSCRVLLVGTGNSPLPLDMLADGFTRVCATDYSPTVVDAMRARYGASHPGVTWRVADMLGLHGLADSSFDLVLDKAAMDAVLADGGDAWDPPPELLAAGDAIMAAVARVLAPGGAYLQLSFGQPHFRRRYLTQRPLLWDGGVTVQSVNVGLGYFLYALRRAAGAW